MGELTIRRQRGVTGLRYQAAEKTEKTAAAGKSQPAAKTAGATVSETLQRLMTRIGQAETHTRESHRTLQMGEAVLAEVQNRLDRIAELAQRAAGDSGADRASLQAELEQLREEIDRMTGGTAAGSPRRTPPRERRSPFSRSLTGCCAEWIRRASPRSVCWPCWG